MNNLFNLVEIEAKNRCDIPNDHGGHSYMSFLVVGKNHQWVLRPRY